NGEQTVEQGWNIDYGLYFDNNVHYFIFATADSYKNGCYNNRAGTPGNCVPFVAFPGALTTPGMTLSTGVTQGQHSYLIMETLFMSVSGVTGWAVGDAGIYPSTGFKGDMQTNANAFRAGGEVSDASQKWLIPMGSGADPNAGNDSAAAIYDVQAIVGT